MVDYSVLDLCPVVEGGDSGDALQRSLDLARHAEKLGYTRYWLAEHHNMPAIASAATAVVIGHVAAGTDRIRVGAGGIMLPNHAPLVIAEQFGTLDALFPGRIDLGLGRAPGTDQATARALRRSLQTDPEQFPDDVMELLQLLDEPQDGQAVRAYPGAGSAVPVWILGSSTFGAQLAAALGLPYAFASHFAPADLMAAISIYRHHFRPSRHLQQSRVMIGVTTIAAEDDAEAEFLATSMQRMFINLRRNQLQPLQPPQADYLQTLSDVELASLGQIHTCAAVGGPERLAQRLRHLIDQTGADELILTGNLFDHTARLRSFEIAAEVMQTINRD